MKTFKKVIFIVLLSLLSFKKGSAQGISKTDSLKALLAGSTADSIRFELNIKIFREYVQSNYTEAEKYIQSAIEVASQTHSPYMIGKAWNNKGMLERNRGNFDTALTYHERALETFLKTDNWRGIADSYSLLGRTYSYKDDYKNALSNHLKAYDLYEKYGKMDDILPSATNLGQLYVTMNDFENGKIFLKKAMEYSEKTGNKMGISVNGLNLGLLYYKKQDYKNALRYLLSSAKLKAEINDQRGLANAWLNIGSVYYDLHDYKQAIIWTNKTIVLSEKLDDKLLFISGKINYAKSIAKQGDIGNAENILDELLPEAKKLGNLTALTGLYEALSEINNKRENYEEAINDLKLSKAVDDSMMNIEKSRQLLELQTKYDTEKKQAQIEVLQKENQLKDQESKQQRYFIISAGGFLVLLLITALLLFNRRDLKRKNELMQAEIRKEREISDMRARIARDIHDDIGASLTRVSLSSRALQSPTTNGEHIQVLAGRINSTTQEVINNLGEIIWSTNPQHDKLSSLLSYLRSYVVEYLESAGIQPELYFPEEFQEQDLHPVLKRNLFLVVKETLNNIVKHASATKVRMDFEINKSKYLITITDNGKGISAEKQNEFSNGLKNMKNRMEEIAGEFQIKPAVPIGTQVIIKGQLNTA